MGKGNRNRNYQEAYDMSGASAAKAGRVNGKKKDRTTLWITLVIAVLLVGSLLLFVFVQVFPFLFSIVLLPLV